MPSPGISTFFLSFSFSFLIPVAHSPVRIPLPSEAHLCSNTCNAILLDSTLFYAVPVLLFTCPLLSLRGASAQQYIQRFPLGSTLVHAVPVPHPPARPLPSEAYLYSNIYHDIPPSYVPAYAVTSFAFPISGSFWLCIFYKNIITCHFATINSSILPVICLFAIFF